MSSFNLDFADFGAVNFDKQEVRIFKISGVTIWTKYYNPKYYIGRDFGPKEGTLYPRNTVIPDRLKYIYDAEGTRHIVPVQHGEIFYLKQVIAIDGFDKTIESIDGSILCFNTEKTDCIDLNDENKTITFPYRNFYSFYFNILYDIKQGDVFINGVLRDLYNFYPDNVVTARAEGIEGFEFDSWELVQGPEIESDLLTKNPISFLGPASDIQLRANFRPDRSQRPVRKVSIINNTSDYGTVEDEYDGIYKQYDSVTLKAVSKHGYFFNGWYSTDLQIEDTSLEEISFEMPDKNIVLYVTFEPYSFNVTIEDNPEGVLTGAGTYKYKDQVQLTAEPINDDYVFDYWHITSFGETIKNLNSNPVFSMPSANVNAESFFRNNIFNLKITNFSDITPVATESQQNGGREVELSSEPPGIGYAFAGWNSKDVKIENNMSQSTKFIMPAKNVEINYSYERRFPNLIIQDAQYGGHAVGGGQKVSGNTVAIAATHEDGFEFVYWKIVNDAKIENFKATDSITAFIMPISDVILQPIFDFVKYNINTSIIRVDLSRELLSSLGAPNLPYSTLDGGRIAIIEESKEPLYVTSYTGRLRARHNVVIKPKADEGFVFDSYYIEYDNEGYYVYDEDFVFAMPTYDVNITATFKEFIPTMSWDQSFATAQIGSTFKLLAETWSGQTVKYKVIRGEEALIGGENDDEVFLGSGEEVEIEAYIEAGSIFPREAIRKVFTPELTARTAISIKGPSSGFQIDANRSIRGISNGLVNIPANGYNVAGVPVTIDIYDDSNLVEYLGLVATSNPTLEDWHKKPLPDNFVKYELIPQYLGDEDSGYKVVENGSEAKRVIFNTPVFPASITLQAKTQLAILWTQDYTIYNVGDTANIVSSHTGVEDEENPIEFVFTIADETIASLDGSVITFLTQGATTITLNFSGNDNYSPKSITKDIIIKKDQVITWDQDLSQVIFGDSPLTLQAQTDGPNPVEYSIYLTALGEINGQNLALNNIEGNTVITAFAPGNELYKDSEELTKEINIYDENKDTDGDGIPDYLDEFPEQISDSITWTQDLSLNAADSLELTAVSDSGSIVYYQFEDVVESTIAEINGSTLSTTLAAAGETLKIKAYTVETTKYFSTENIRIMVVAVPRDSDGDGIPDVDDPWAFQQDDSITWVQDLSSVNAASDVAFTASSGSGSAVLYRFSWNAQTPEPSSTYGALNNGVFSADLGAEGFEIRIEAYTEDSEYYFSASSIRTFTILYAIDSDGDGIPDVNDPWAFQQDDSITWVQDLSSINAGTDATFTASSGSGSAVLYRFSWNTQTPEPSSTYGALNNGVFSADLGAEGFEIRIEAYTEDSEGYFSASSIRTFTIIESAAPLITFGNRVVINDFYERDWADFGEYLPRQDYIISDGSGSAIGEVFHLATASNGETISYAIEPEDEGILILYLSGPDRWIMYIDTQTTGKVFNLTASTQGAENVPAASETFTFTVTGNDYATVTWIDPETGEAPNVGVFNNSYDDVLYRYKDYEIQITLASGRAVTGFQQPSGNNPSVVRRDNKWIVHSLYEWTGTFTFYTDEESISYNGNIFETPQKQFLWVPIFIDTFNNGTVSTKWLHGTGSFAKIITAPFSQKGAVVDLVFEPDANYEPIDEYDDWENILLVGVDSEYTEFYDLLPSTYQVYRNGPDFEFYMKDLPARISASDVFKLKTYSQDVIVDINGTTTGANSDIAYTEPRPGYPNLTKYYFEHGETVKITLKLTDDNGTLPTARTLASDPQFSYVDANGYQHIYPASDVTETIIDAETRTYEYVILGNSEAVFDLNEPSPITVTINAAEEYDWYDDTVTGVKGKVTIYVDDSFYSTVFQGSNYSWPPVDVSVYEGQKISLRYEKGYHQRIEEPVVTTSSGDDVSSTTVVDHSSVTEEYKAVQHIGGTAIDPVPEQIFEIIVPSDIDGLTVDCKIWDISYLSPHNEPIACGYKHTIFLNAYGEVYTCGYNNYGQLGLGAGTANTSSPQKVPIPNPIVQISAGDHHSVAVDIYGGLWLWGRNNHGQMLLDSNRTDQYTPVKYTLQESYKKISQITSGKNHTAILILLTTNSILANVKQISAWGANGNGQLGINNTTDQGTLQTLLSRFSTSDTPDGSRSSFTTILKAGGNTTIFITAASNDGPGFLAGQNFCNAGGSTNDMLVATAIFDGSGEYGLGLSGCAIADEHVIFMRDSGSGTANEIWAAGRNQEGQLGLGSTSNTINYVMQSTGQTGGRLATGPINSYFISYDDSEMYGCGDNSVGQLNQPINVNAQNSFVRMHAGENVEFMHVISTKLNSGSGQSFVTYRDNDLTSFCQYTKYFALGFNYKQFGDADAAETFYSSSTDFVTRNGQAFNPFPIDLDRGC